MEAKITNIKTSTFTTVHPDSHSNYYSALEVTLEFQRAWTSVPKERTFNLKLSRADYTSLRELLGNGETGMTDFFSMIRNLVSVGMLQSEQGGNNE